MNKVIQQHNKIVLKKNHDKVINRNENNINNTLLYTYAALLTLFFLVSIVALIMEIVFIATYKGDPELDIFNPE
jgi:hypothetical protein